MIQDRATYICNFRFLLNQYIRERINTLKATITDHLMMNEPATDLQNEYRSLMTLEQSIVWPEMEGDRAEAVAALVPQWPANLPALPQWLSDPDQFDIENPPGPALIVDGNAA